MCVYTRSSRVPLTKPWRRHLHRCWVHPRREWEENIASLRCFCVQILHNSLTSRRTGEALGGAKMCCYKYGSEDMLCVSAGRREEAVLLWCVGGGGRWEEVRRSRPVALGASVRIVLGPVGADWLFCHPPQKADSALKCSAPTPALQHAWCLIHREGNTWGRVLRTPLGWGGWGRRKNTGCERARPFFFCFGSL